MIFSFALLTNAPPMSHSVSLTPRSSPGSIPTEHTTQKHTIEEFTWIAAFISGVLWETLSNINSVPSEPEIRSLLHDYNFPDARIQPKQTLTNTCERIFDWLHYYGRRSSASRDIIPIALAILLRFRIRNANKGALLEYDDSVKLVVAIKTARGNTCDQWMHGKAWKKSTGIKAEDIKKAQNLFLDTIEWRIWVGEHDFCEFVKKFGVVWDEMPTQRKQGTQRDAGSD
jgi:hypothetical protein